VSFREVPSKQVSLFAGLIKEATPGSIGIGSSGAQLLSSKIKPPKSKTIFFMIIL
jgi:hypothetical protein